MEKDSSAPNGSLDDLANEGYSDDELVTEPFDAAQDNGEASEEAGREIIKKLRKRLKACEKEKKEYLDGWQRSKADFLNARKQDAKVQKITLEYSKERVVKDILPVIDSFDIAFQDKAKNKDPEWSRGIGNIHAQLVSILRGYGVNEINSEGEIFDPSRHDPIETVSTSRKEEDNHVTAVLQKGYEMNGRVIRAARVRVAHFK